MSKNRAAKNNKSNIFNKFSWKNVKKSDKYGELMLRHEGKCITDEDCVNCIYKGGVCSGRSDKS